MPAKVIVIIALLLIISLFIRSHNLEFRSFNCTDTDQDDILHSQGICNDGVDKKDYCRNTRYLMEYGCAKENVCILSQYDCLGEGKICKDNMCVSPTCIDSDNGVSLENKGICEYRLDEEQKNMSDSCDSKGVLTEYACDPITDKCVSSRYDCRLQDKSCSNGACITP